MTDEGTVSEHITMFWLMRDEVWGVRLGSANVWCAGSERPHASSGAARRLTGGMTSTVPWRDNDAVSCSRYRCTFAPSTPTTAIMSEKETLDEESKERERVREHGSKKEEVPCLSG